MDIVGLPFLGVALATVMLLRFTPLRTRRVEVFGLASIVFVATISPLADATCLAGMAITGLLFAKALARRKSGWLLGFGIASIVAEFLLSRQVLPLTPLAVGPTIGLSYVMFRVIHLMVDAQGDELPPDLRLRDRLCFLFCYLTFLAGPIARAQDFKAEAARPIRTTLRDAAADHLPGVVNGYLKATVLAGAAFACFTWSQVVPLPAPVGHAAGWTAFAAYLYLSFAGYTDVVRGIGGLVDFHLPENFAQPWAAANFLDLWSRWHISLSEWFKLYVFNPVTKALIGTVQRPALVPYLGAAGYFVTFFLMGLWHGISLRFVLYGLCLGAGVSINKLYQAVMLKRLGRKRLNELTRGPAYAAVARSLAVSFFVLALGFLWIPVGAGGLAGWLAGGALLVMAIAALSLAAPLLSRLDPWPRRTAALCTIEAAAVLAYLLLHGPVPPLLYGFF